MYRFSSGLVTAVAATVVAFVPASAALARGVVVDGSFGETSWQAQPVCTYGQSCAGITLGFNINIGQGLTNKIFVYNNGLVSIGTALTSSVNPITALSDLSAQNVFTPFLSYDPDTAAPYQADTGFQGNGLSAAKIPFPAAQEFEAVYGVIDDLTP